MKRVVKMLLSCAMIMLLFSNWCSANNPEAEAIEAIHNCKIPGQWTIIKPLFQENSYTVWAIDTSNIKISDAKSRRYENVSESWTLPVMKVFYGSNNCIISTNTYIFYRNLERTVAYLGTKKYKLSTGELVAELPDYDIVKSDSLYDKKLVLTWPDIAITNYLRKNYPN